MALKFITDLNLGKNELQNARLQNLATAPSNPVKGLMYYDTVANKVCIYNGTAWEPVGAVDISGKADKVTGATAGHFASLDANGNLTDSGRSDSDYADAEHDHTVADITDIASTYIPATAKGAANGIASLGSDGKVPSGQLPSFVDDVVDAYIVSGATAFSTGWLSLTSGGSALTPEGGKIYIVISDGDYKHRTYRWSGSTYAEISPSLVIGTTSDTAASGDRGLPTGGSTGQVLAKKSGGNYDSEWITPIKKYVATNPALTPSGGVCTWTVSHGLGVDEVLVTVYDVSTGTEVIADVTHNETTVIIGINASATVAAGTYKAVIMG